MYLFSRQTLGPIGVDAVVFGSVHTAPEKFKNAALFLQLGLPSTLIRHEMELFENALQTGGIWKLPAFRFCVDGQHFENGAFRKRWRRDNQVISPTEFSSNTYPKWPVIAAYLDSSGVVWTENI